MFSVLLRDKKSRARVGKLLTRHGVIETPAYVIVGTYAQVRALRKDDISKTKTQIVIVNTYHMWRSLGDEGLLNFPGLHEVMGREGPIMTDSGGFQVFSLGASREKGIGKVEGNLRERKPEASLVNVGKNGVWFREGGTEFYLDAEKSIKIQERLGADIIVAFDECTSPSHSYEYTKEANRRTHEWAERSLGAHKENQLLFGVVQGGAFEDLRKESAEFIGSLPFAGYGIGGAFGSSYGAEKSATFEELDWVVPLLPEEKPRHLLGIGKIEDIFEAVSRGVDMFDCVIPTREARHGSLWTINGRFDVTRGMFQNDKDLIDPGCSCPVCREFKMDRRQIYKLFKEKNPEGGRLATIHNVYFFNDLMRKIREAISGGGLDTLRHEYLAKS